MNPVVTLVVPTMGGRHAWLEDSLGSIVSQRAVDVRVVVVAPTSADVRLGGVEGVDLCRYEGSGLSRAVNWGWRLYPESEYVAWLGDDDLLAPGSLAATVAAMVGSTNLSMVYGQVRYIDGRSNTLWFARSTRFAAPYLRFGKNFLRQQGSLLRRAAIEEVGWLDPSLKNAMDQELFTRLGRAGERRYIAKELGAFRLHGSGITLSKGADDESDQVRERFFSPAGRRGYRAWRRIGRRLDWAADAIERRLPVPPVPKNGWGVPYTRPHAWHRSSAQ